MPAQISATAEIRMQTGLRMIETLADLIRPAASKTPDAIALRSKADEVSYAELDRQIDGFAANLLQLGLRRYERVAVFAGKQIETVVAAFGATRAGGTFVPVNALFKPAQVAYILADCNVRVLVTTRARARDLQAVLDDAKDLRHVILLDDGAGDDEAIGRHIRWNDLPPPEPGPRLPRMLSSDMAAIMYTSGSTGKPKGVVLSHANVTIGGLSVASYLENDAQDRILAVLPFSFDAGFSQLTTAFSVGASVVLHDYFLARDVIRLIEKEAITGITGVPPLWMQLIEPEWPEGAGDSVRYFANTGGKMPLATLQRLRQVFPNALPFLMYGLTESFRSTYLPPSQVDKRPDSIGIAIPNVEVMVVGDDGTPCSPGQAGELVHRGPLVSLGYWNDPQRTATRFKPVPNRPPEIVNPELAVFSGDTVVQDDEGFLYFVGRKDDMIKTSGYRISPMEIEEVAYNTGLVSEVAALGIPHERLGHGILLVARPADGLAESTDELLKKMRSQVPNYMVPLAVVWKNTLPRNANGKLDRRLMTEEYQQLFAPGGGE